jgi:hypothetical protein
MRRVSLRGPTKLPRRRRLLVYAILFGLWASGAVWLLLHEFLQRKGAFGPEPHPAEPWVLKAHGAFAFASLWLLGLLWGVHVLNGWHAARRRWSGAVLLGVLGVLGVTGYLLYYSGDDAVRAIVSKTHWIIGLGAPALFLLHRFARERQEARAKRHPSAERLHEPAD